MKKALLSGIAILALAACGKKDAAEAPGHSARQESGAPELGGFGVDLAAIDEAVKPGDDFYAYVNGKWLSEFEIPDEYSSYGSFTVLAERSEQRLKEIVESSEIQKAMDGTNEQKARDLYASFLDIDAINAKGLEPLAADLARIDGITTPADFAALAFSSSMVAKSPVGYFIGVDAKQPDRYAVYLTQSGLGMPNRDYYLEEKFADKQTKYKAYIADTLARAGLGDVAAADAVYALENEIARVHWEPAKRRNRDLTYNPKTIEALGGFAPNAPWSAMLESAGLSSVGEVIVREDDAVRNIAEIVAATPVDTLKAYLRFHLINAGADVLPAEYDDAKFAFFGTELRGTPKQKERWKRATAAVDNSLGEAVGKIYVEKYFPATSKAMMIELVANLRTSLGERLETLEWMSDETRSKAAEKLAKFTPKIGYPDKWRDYAALNVVAGDAYGNAKRALQFEWDYEVARLNDPVDRGEWGMTPPTVNAYYNPTLNEIVFPAAILQPPFFDPNADAAVNYGGIGAVIGHEIGHGFDDQGRKSDGDGVLRDWWTSEDAERFKERADKLGAQYATYEPIAGFPINPGLTMGENIGDLGGLAMAYHAYKLSLRGEEAPVIDGLTGDQRFFLSWAQVWKRVVRDEQLKNQIASDPHSPAQYRVNGIVRNMDAWYDAFGVTPDSELWLDPEERVQIW